MIIENDPDVIRAGLQELAETLDQAAAQCKDPMAAIREQLAA
jgi:hypothetical protein